MTEDLEYYGKGSNLYPRWVEPAGEGDKEWDYIKKAIRIEELFRSLTGGRQY